MTTSAQTHRISTAVFAVGVLTLSLSLIAQDSAGTQESGGNAAEMTDKQDGNLQSAAGVFIDLLSQREFQQASANFDETMKRGRSPQELKQVWGQLISEVGLLKEQGEIRIQQAGEYRVVDVSCAFEHGTRVVRVSFNRKGQVAGLFFRPPQGGGASQLNLALLASYIIAVFVDITAPFLLALLLWRRFQCRWRFWLVGLLVFLLFQGATRIPLVLALQSYPPFQELLQQPSYLWTWLLLLCFTAGLFEEGGRALAFRYAIAPEDRKWSTAAMLGAGHGGLEAMGVGFIVLMAMINYVVILVIPPETLGIAQDTIELARGQFTTVRGWEPLMGAWERICMIIVHLALSVMVLQAFLNRRMWWWCALFVHTLINFTGSAILQLGTAAWGRPIAMLATEAAATFYAMIALWYVVAMHRQDAGRSNATATSRAAG